MSDFKDAKRIIKIGGQEIDLDPDNLKFNESTLTDYLQKEGGFYNNFGGYLAMAEFLLQRRELDYDALYGDKFKSYKDEGGSDKYNESRTAADPDVREAKEKVINAKFRVRLLQQHLRAWDKNHENVQSLGHNLRKEMDKLNADIMGTTSRTDRFNASFLDDDVESRITHVNADGTVN